MLAAHAHSPAPWLPSFDLHEEDGAIVLHADLPDGDDGAVDVALDGDVLVLSPFARLPLPFTPHAVVVMERLDHAGLDVRLSL